MVAGAAQRGFGEVLTLPGVAPSVEAARCSVDRLLTNPLLRRQSAAVSGESAVRGARASAALAGVDVPLGELRAALAADRGTTERQAPAMIADPTVQGALRVQPALAGLAEVWRRAPLQALARLHLLAATGLVAPDDLGRPRVDPTVAMRLRALADAVVADQTTAAVVVAAVVHGELLALAAFPQATGVVARAAARLCLIARGLDPKSLVVAEVGHLAMRSDYRRTAAGYAAGGAENVAAWVRHCAEATTAGATEAIAICEAIRRR